MAYLHLKFSNILYCETVGYLNSQNMSTIFKEIHRIHITMLCFSVLKFTIYCFISSSTENNQL